jgi:tetrahydromethanopterin S-methyltransferase subunit D
MENVFAKVEGFLEEKFKEFEKAPIKTSIKILLVVLLAKMIIKFLNK